MKNLPTNTGDVGLIPRSERIHMAERLGLCTTTVEPVLGALVSSCWNSFAAITEACDPGACAPNRRGHHGKGLAHHS